ncbi:MAG: thiolase family protein [Proteobacteria bacterium]|jgi:acetyl-CoA acetyltransferase|nr:thiolase family protein [Pseudomonadota bacterium]
MRDVVVLGVGMHKFGKFLDLGIKDLSRVAAWEALKDAGITPKDIQVAYVGNAMAGLLTGQECIRGQVVLREIGLVGIPITNVENACASASTAFREAWIAVGSGLYDVALALGFEKLYSESTVKSLEALAANTDVFLEGKMGFLFAGAYAMNIQRHMKEYGTTREQLAMVTVKNRKNACYNPFAQYRSEVTVDEVLNSRMIADPITLLMCAPMGDGAAAAVLCSKKFARKKTTKPIYVAASSLKSGAATRNIRALPKNIVERCAEEAYERAGLGPEDIDVAEVHDAMAPAELLVYEQLGFCGKGESGAMIASGKTNIGGPIPVNTSGGLSSKGHPVGSTGLAQIAEITWQLREQAENRQVQGAKIGLTENGGGIIEGEGAVVCIHILKR